MIVGVVTFHLCIEPAVCDEHKEEDTAVHLTAPWYQELALYIDYVLMQQFQRYYCTDANQHSVGLITCYCMLLLVLPVPVAQRVITYMS